MKLFNYQKEAVRQVCSHIDSRLNGGNADLIQFESTTGSGKTIMSAAIITDITIKHSDVAWIWIAPQTLHDQSRIKFTKFNENDNGGVKFSVHSADAIPHHMNSNGILFTNWDSINKKNNKAVTPTESGTSIYDMISNTMKRGIRVILVIDESHNSSNTRISQGIIKKMNPLVTLEMSATIVRVPNSRYVEVSLDDVIAEEVIRKGIVINKGNNDYKAQTDNSILDLSMKYYEEIRAAYHNHGREDHVPLMLVQIPNSYKDNSANMERTLTRYLAMLGKKGKTVENGKVAVLLHGDKRNIMPSNDANGHDQPEPGVEILIFKQAIALGWDCPRAQILTLFRENKGEKFTIQLFGRILRVSYLGSDGHYGDPLMDYGMVFTVHEPNYDGNSSSAYLIGTDIERNNDLWGDGLGGLQHQRLDKNGEKTDPIKSDLRKLLKKQLNPIVTGLKTDLDTQLNTSWVGETIVDDIGNFGNIHNIKTGTGRGVEDTIAVDAVQRFVSSNMPKNSKSKKHVEYFADILMEYIEHAVSGARAWEAAAIILNSEVDPSNDTSNSATIGKCISDADAIHYKRQYKVATRKINEEEFTIAPMLKLTERVHTYPRFRKYIMEKPVMPLLNPLEEAFADFLESQVNVKWWFKNGIKTTHYFSVAYTDSDGNGTPFFPDFLIMLNDGTFLIYDTKNPQSNIAGNDKLDGLNEYRNDFSGKDGACNVEVGFILNTNNDDPYSGAWEIRPTSKSGSKMSLGTIG